MAILPETSLTKRQVWLNSLKLYKNRFFEVYFLSLLLGAIPLFMGASFIADLETVHSKILSVIMIAAWFFVGLVFSYAVYHQLGHAAKGEGVDLGYSLKQGVSQLPRYLFAGIIYLIAILLGSLLLVIPGIYLLVALIPFFVIVVMEGKHPWNAFKDSRALVRNHWWHTLAVLAIPAIIISLILSGLGILEFFISGPMAATISFVVKSLVWPFFIALHVVIWHDLKQRSQVEKVS